MVEPRHPFRITLRLVCMHSVLSAALLSTDAGSEAIGEDQATTLLAQREDNDLRAPGHDLALQGYSVLAFDLDP